MSRVGKLPITVPQGVSVEWSPPLLKVKGPKGELSVEVRPPAGVDVAEEAINITRPDDQRESKSFQGLYRSLVNNAVAGVSQGYEKKLEVVGVGYKAEVAGDVLKLSLGFAAPKSFAIPEGVDISVAGGVITVQGIDKQKVADVAARLRFFRPPEPYKGKGIRFQGEQLRRKAGKAAVGGQT